MSAPDRQLTIPVWRSVSSRSSGRPDTGTESTRFVLEMSTANGADGNGSERATAGSNDTTAARTGSIAADRTVSTDGGRNQGDQRSATREQTSDGDAVSITVLDRETVRISGDLEEVLLSLCWWDDSGQLGTITEPIDGVTGERVVTASAAFDDQEFAHGPVVTGVEGFTTAGPSVPGTGDVSASNPDVEAHVDAVRDEYDGPGGLEGPFPDEH